MTKRLPRYVTAFLSQHGRVRYRFRKKGQPSYYFQSRLGTKAFMAEYQAFLQGEPFAKPIEKKAPKPNQPDRELSVYFIGGPSGPIKIGVSKDPKRRLAGLQTNSPYHLKLLAIAPGGVEEERFLHAKFAHLRLKGEWFKRDPELLDEMMRIKRSKSHQFVSPHSELA